MDLRQLTEKDRIQYNNLVTHVIQSWEWGEFRSQMGIPVLRYGIFKKGKMVTAFQLTLHQIPLLNQQVGYLPKGPLPDKLLAEALTLIGQKHNCLFIKVEPDIAADTPNYSVHPQFSLSPKPLFTKFNFVLDLTKTEDELLAQLHQKTRYNLRLAQKKGVTVKITDEDKAFEDYLKLYFETTERQGYHGHNETYHRTVWKLLKSKKMAKVAVGYYQNKPLSSWMLVHFKNKLYYPYGGSSSLHREVMANNLVAWEAILYGKSLKLKQFDLWGALGPDADPKDPWQGFHRFKQGYGGKLVEYVGTYDLIFNTPLYYLFNLIDQATGLKITLLKLLGK